MFERMKTLLTFWKSHLEKVNTCSTCSTGSLTVLELQQAQTGFLDAEMFAHLPKKYPSDGKSGDRDTS